MTRAHEDAEVIVVGAGLAGLVTAIRLRQAGVSTIVLEATDQVGGRTRSQLVGGRVLDIGGQLVGTDYVRLRRLAAGLGLHLRPDARFPRLRTDAAARPELSPETLTGLHRAARQLRGWCATLPASAPWEAPEAASLDRVSLADWLESAPIGPRLTRLLRHAITAFTLAPAERLSLLHVLTWLLPAGGISGLWRETRWSIQEGAQDLSRRIATRLTTPPVLETPVTAVEQATSRATVHSADGRSWNARQVALCVPLPTTSAITFAPELPDEQKHLLANVASPRVTKLIASRSPGNAAAPLVHVGDPLLRLAARESTYALGFAYSDDATREADQLRDHLLDRLNMTTEDIDGFVAYPWHEQPYAQGGYPAFAPGQLTRHGHALRTSHGRVHFAGADRSTWPGTMEGAIRDGHRVANHIRNADQL